MDANNHLDDEIQSRRQDELEALQAFYGHQLRSSLPADFSPPHHHHRGGDNNDHDSHQEISLNGPWFIELLDSSTDSITGRANNYCKIPTLEIRLPPHYPLSPPPQSCQNSPTPILHHIDHLNLLSSTQKQELIEELMDMYEPEMDMAILWAERCRQEFLDVVDLATLMSSANEATEIAVAEVSNDTPSTGQTTENNSQHEKQPTKTMSYPSIRFLTFNHLLYSKSHKKESQIVSLASKLGHIGFIVYGTPGIIGLLVMMSSDNGDDNEDVIDFAKECSTRIGKRATVLDYEIKFDHDGGLLPSSFEVEGRRTCGDDGGKTKKNKKSKNSKGGNNSKGNNSSTTTGESSAPLLVNLLGADRVTTRNGSVSIANMKSGLRHFDSLAELKEVLPGEVVPNILGL